MNIALFGGSFDPIHNGHLCVANFVANLPEIDKVWFLISPQNPLKSAEKQTTFSERKTMVELAISGNEKFEICDVEENLPKPNYTIDTLNFLTKNFPSHTFSLIIGTDNLAVFERWKNHETIVENHKILVYPRENFEKITFFHKNIQIINAPKFDVSSSEIRQKILKNEPLKNLLPEKIQAFINEKNLYKNPI